MRRHVKFRSKSPSAALLLAGVFALSAGCSVDDPALFGQERTVSTDPGESAKLQEVESECKNPSRADDISEQLLRLVNFERFEIGGVDLDSELSAVAADYACSMIDGHFFGHENPETGEKLLDRITASGYVYITIGENLAAGLTTAPEILDAWLASESHRAVLLDPAFTRAGIAVRHGGEYGVYCVMLLAEQPS